MTPIQNYLKKITENLNIYENNTNFEGKPSFKNGAIIAEDTNTALPNADKKQQGHQNKP